MDRRPEQHVLLFVAAFYIVVALVSVGLLKYGKNYLVLEDKENAAVDILKTNDLNVDKEEELPPDPGVITTEEAEEEYTEEETESVQPVEEEIVEEEAVEEDTSDTGYYQFIASNSAGRLNVRKEPSVKAKIIYRLHIGDKGYVLDIGDEWSHVSVSGNVGYCANEYLSLQEIDEDDFPEELRSMVGQSPVPEEE